jgi:hypothetical protein
VRILSTIVLPPPALIPAFDPKLSSGHQPLRSEGILLEKFTHQFQGDVLVSLGLNQSIGHLAFGVDRPPKVDHSAVDFQIKTPLQLRPPTRRSNR